MPTCLLHNVKYEMSGGSVHLLCRSISSFNPTALMCQVAKIQTSSVGFDVQVDELLKENTAIESHLTVYPACGHIPMDDCRERFIQDLIDIVGAHLAPVQDRLPKDFSELPKPAMSGNPD